MEDVRVEHGRSHSARRRRKTSLWIVGALLFLIAIVGLGVILALHFVAFRRAQYGIVFDAGSSHSDMSLFRWPGDKIEETGVVVEVTKCDVKGPGISSYNNTPDDAGRSIEDCLNEAKRKVPEDRMEYTPVYMGATAGMRLLDAESPEKAAAVFAAIEKRFDESGFKYEEGYVRIIDGVEEGMSAWISANLLLGLLGEDGVKKETAGTLDMGGASTQISFETSGRGENAQDGDYQDLRLYGHDFPTFAHTYLCFGMNEAARRFKSELVLAERIGELRFENPCFNTDYTEIISASDLFNTKCTRISEVDPKTRYTLVGTGDTAKCALLVRELLNATLCRSQTHKECFDDTVVPEVPYNKKFLAISGYYHTAKFFDALETTPNGFEALVDKYCNETWAQAQTHSGVKAEFLSRNCFVGHYVHQILTEIYKFDTDEKWKSIEFSLSIAGVSSGWTLGFMTNSTNALPVEAIRAIHPQVFISLLIVFLVLLLIIAIVGYRAYARSRSRSSTLN